MKKISKEVLDIIEATNLDALRHTKMPTSKHVYEKVLVTIMKINELRAEDAKLPNPSLCTVQRKIKELKAHNLVRTRHRRYHTELFFRRSSCGPEATAPSEHLDFDFPTQTC